MDVSSVQVHQISLLIENIHTAPLMSLLDTSRRSYEDPYISCVLLQGNIKRVKRCLLRLVILLDLS